MSPGQSCADASPQGGGAAPPIEERNKLGTPGKICEPGQLHSEFDFLGFPPRPWRRGMHLAFDASAVKARASMHLPTGTFGSPTPPSSRHGAVIRLMEIRMHRGPESSPTTSTVPKTASRSKEELLLAVERLGAPLEYFTDPLLLVEEDRFFRDRDDARGLRRHPDFRLHPDAATVRPSAGMALKSRCYIFVTFV